MPFLLFILFAASPIFASGDEDFRFSFTEPPVVPAPESSGKIQIDLSTFEFICSHATSPQDDDEQSKDDDDMANIKEVLRMLKFQQSEKSESPVLFSFFGNAFEELIAPESLELTLEAYHLAQTDEEKYDILNGVDLNAGNVSDNDKLWIKEQLARLE